MVEKGCRVRFAPSPTGRLHLGNAHTALFNWLYARQVGGCFVLRMEDTDELRSSKEYEESIYDDLRWLGMDWDEGPQVGGEYGPYHQTQRSSFYRQALEALRREGHVYPCFCSPQELEDARQAMLAKGQVPHYSGRCRKLSEKEVAELSQTRQPTLRFRLPDEGEVIVDDLIRGPIRFSCEEIGDWIMVRSDGTFTYNFAVAVDDGLMEIDLVLRGEDHISNTPRQILVAKALGTRPMRFGHLPLLLGQDRSKLSKRHGSFAIADFRQKGVLSQALFNYLAVLGHAPRGEEVMTIPQMIAEFSLERVGRSGSIFDPEKLAWFQGQHLRRLAPQELAQLIPGIDSNLLLLYAEEGGELQDLEAKARALAGFIPEVPPELPGGFLEALARLPESIWGDPQALAGELKQIPKVLGVKAGEVFRPLRQGLTGTHSGPELARILSALGREQVLSRLSFGKPVD